jgi:hypothetical protein
MKDWGYEPEVLRASHPCYPVGSGAPVFHAYRFH